MAILGSIVDRILSLPGWAALAIVFALPALEASAFIGFVFPGEIAVLLGGVLAFEHRISLGAAIAAGVSGAIIGDTIGYWIGRRWGRAILRGTLGRLPIIRQHLDKYLDRARDYLQRRRGRAIFFGRFTAALRVLIPGLAGMSDIHFPTFLAYNAAGGALWGTGFVLLGFVAGAGYRRIEKIAGRASLALLILVILAIVLARTVRWVRGNPERVRAFGDRLASTAAMKWIRRRFPSQLAWARRRLDPRSPRGLALTTAVAAAALCLWAFGGLIQDVVAHEEMANLDPRVERWVLAHRSGSLTVAMKTVTWLGSTAVLVPLALLVAAVFLARRRTWRPAAQLATILGGAVVLYNVFKPLVERPRPPVRMLIGMASGWAFPSGHATQAVATYGMIALLMSVGRSARFGAFLWGGVAVIVLAVGASRVYLGAHWFTDVLGGYALGAAWLAIVASLSLITIRQEGPSADGRQRPALAA